MADLPSGFAGDCAVRDVVCTWRAKNIGTVDGFLSPAECEAYVRLGETLGYDEAPISTQDGPALVKDFRNNDRAMLDDAVRADQLWQRIAPVVPSPFRNRWWSVGVSERLRFYRHDIGRLFDWHLDGYFATGCV
jgi:hypothetical protein